METVWLGLPRMDTLLHTRYLHPISTLNRVCHKLMDRPLLRRIRHRPRQAHLDRRIRLYLSHLRRPRRVL